MRRRTRLSLAIGIPLGLLLGAYTALWLYIAGRIEDGIVQWAEAARGNNLDLSWRRIGVSGYPLSFLVELTEPRLRDTSAGAAAGGSSAEMRAPLVTASTYPWSFRSWRLHAPGGIGASAERAGAPLATLTAGTAEGGVAVAGEGDVRLWLELGDAAIEAGVRLGMRQAALTLTLPQGMPSGSTQSHDQPAGSATLQLRDVTLPAVPSPLRNPVEQVGIGITLKGVIPPGTARAAGQAWRDAGGTLELDQLALRWGSLALDASGTAALDAELQPVGAFAGHIEGADELLGALVASGRLRPGDAQLARLALSVLAKPGPNGRPRIATSFTIQDGDMRLGPARLGKAPRIAWE